MGSLPSASNQTSASATDPDSLAQHSLTNTLKNTTQTAAQDTLQLFQTPQNPSAKRDRLLVVRNIPFHVDRDQLREKFSKFGPLKAFKKRGHQDYCLVEFRACKDALEAKSA